MSSKLDRYRLRNVMEQTGPEHPPPTIIDVVRDVSFNFVEFASRNLLTHRPPAIFLVLWLIGMDAMAGAIETVNVNTGSYPVDNWFHAWVLTMGVGLPVGALRYWIVGSIFHLIVRLAGGRRSAYASRNVFLYSALPATVVDLSLKVLQMLLYGNGYFAQHTPTAIDGVFSFVTLAAYGYSVYLCYIGMLRVLGTERVRTILALGAIALAAMLVMSALMPRTEG